MPGSSISAACAESGAGRWDGSISFTCTTPPEPACSPPASALRVGRQYILAVRPVGNSTSTAPGRPVPRASPACPSRTAWSPASSTWRARSFIITTSLLSASTMPLVRLQARRYSCSSSSSSALESVSRAWVIWSAVVFTRATSSGSASFRQQVRSTAPIVLPVMGWWIGTPAQARSSRFSA